MCANVLAEKMNDRETDKGCNPNLDFIGRLHNLERYIVCNPAQPNHVSPGSMASTVEAIIGAVYLNGGIDAVKSVMGRLGLLP